ncbi:vitamin B12-dependent ribonucleotide reductase [candidate division KSB1 bacterium]|nr:vitamin B12-dependent ribonucleotide reductase [candidate division KSB1 bacterium]
MSSKETNNTHTQLKQESKKGRAIKPFEQTGDNHNGSSAGLQMEPFFTGDSIHPFEKLKWVRRTALINNEKGEIVFEQKDVEFSSGWSQIAINVVSSKYFHGKPGTARRETSLKQLINRVAGTIRTWGRADGYFADDESADVFYRELTHLLVNQYAAFNSPVWFNCGIEAKPQCSACFINSVEDSMESILELAKTEGMLFKWGSGTGTNLSPLRSSREKLSTGGDSSGPVSFMKGYDAFAGVIKSGGKTRRAAKMVILNIDHPDIVEFINCKAREEKKAWALIDAGYDGSFNGEAYSSVFFQNSNNSVRVTDNFMQAALANETWQTRAIIDGHIIDTLQADNLLNQIAAAAHLCGDPGLQFDTTINAWHTCPVSARINASNPCSEYMFVDNSACNLASLNLLKFRKENGTFDEKAFSHAVRILIIAQDILVHNAAYPTKAIEKNSHAYRTLGLGYANIGALLMANGLPYDSDQGRAFAAAITALMTGQAYATSAEIAEALSPFPQYQKNRQPMLEVIQKHISHLETIKASDTSPELLNVAQRTWQNALRTGKQAGYRNAQVTVLAPTGTIGFMMDCDTTGIEPDIALIKYKKLVGGGTMKLVNSTIPISLKKLGYTDEERKAIIDYIHQNDTIEGAPGLAEEHLMVFDCAFKPLNGKRSISVMGHIKMMAAVQPFISGAISKTVNLQNNATVEDVKDAYIQAWKLGLKAIAIYRDGAKRTQPLSTSNSADAEKAPKTGMPKPYRRRLPDERASITHKFSVAGHEGYLTVGMYEDGTPGEIFVTMAKEGSVVSGLIDGFATAISMTLQYGVPLNVLVDKFSHMRFEPSGFTQNRQIPMAKSILDYIFRWLALKFLPEEEQPKNGNPENKTLADYRNITNPERSQAHEKHIFQTQSDAPPCSECGAIMVRNGSCYKCLSCGSTSGCS